jgi:hypothetical protein
VHPLFWGEKKIGIRTTDAMDSPEEITIELISQSCCDINRAHSFDHECHTVNNS